MLLPAAVSAILLLMSNQRFSAALAPRRTHPVKSGPADITGQFSRILHNLVADGTAPWKQKSWKVYFHGNTSRIRSSRPLYRVCSLTLAIIIEKVSLLPTSVTQDLARVTAV